MAGPPAAFALERFRQKLDIFGSVSHSFTTHVQPVWSIFVMTGSSITARSLRFALVFKAFSHLVHDQSCRNLSILFRASLIPCSTGFPAGASLNAIGRGDPCSRGLSWSCHGVSGLRCAQTARDREPIRQRADDRSICRRPLGCSSNDARPPFNETSFRSRPNQSTPGIPESQRFRLPGKPCSRLPRRDRRLRSISQSDCHIRILLSWVSLVKRSLAFFCFQGARRPVCDWTGPAKRGRESFLLSTCVRAKVFESEKTPDPFLPARYLNDTTAC